MDRALQQAIYASLQSARAEQRLPARPARAIEPFRPALRAAQPRRPADAPRARPRASSVPAGRNSRQRPRAREEPSGGVAGAVPARRGALAREGIVAHVPLERGQHAVATGARRGDAAAPSCARGTRRPAAGSDDADGADGTDADGTSNDTECSAIVNRARAPAGAHADDSIEAAVAVAAAARTERAPRPRFESSASHDPRLVAALEECLVLDPSALGLSGGFEQVIGCKPAKRVLMEAAILPLLLPHFFVGARAPWRGVLLHGPPGTGKTLLAKALAVVASGEGGGAAARGDDAAGDGARSAPVDDAATAPPSCASASAAATPRASAAGAAAPDTPVAFFSLSASSLVSKMHGESEKLARTLFAMARHYAPAIVFIDEIDALTATRGAANEHEASRRLKSELLAQMDGLFSMAASAPVAGTGPGSAAHAPAPPPRVLVVGATNHPWDIDDAMLRRLEKRVYVPLPDHSARLALLRMRLGSGSPPSGDTSTPGPAARSGGVRLDEGVDLDGLAERTAGLSAADIGVLCREASMRPMRRAIEGKGARAILAMDAAGELAALPVTAADLDAALAETQPTVSAAAVARYEAFDREHGASHS